MKTYYNPKVTYLIIPKSEEKEKLYYDNKAFEVPKIGPRPPYYYNPRYDHYFPVI